MREIDLSNGYDNLSEDEKIHLAARGQLPTSVWSVEEQRDRLDPNRVGNRLALEDRANTGDVNLDGVSKEELEAELERRRSELVEDPRTLMTPEGLEGAQRESEVEIVEDSRPYSEWKPSELEEEIRVRNELRERDGQDPLDTPKTKPAMVKVLEADDASEDDDEE